VLVRSELRKGIRFFDKESNEQFIWWKLDKDFFHMKQDLFICSVYIPPQNSPRERRLDRDHFQSLQENIYKFSKLGSIILCGDSNARIGDLDDCKKNTSVLEDFFPSTCSLNGSIEIESRNSKDNPL
jgi:exonuclease III